MDHGTAPAHALYILALCIGADSFLRHGTNDQLLDGGRLVGVGGLVPRRDPAVTRRCLFETLPLFSTVGVRNLFCLHELVVFLVALSILVIAEQLLGRLRLRQGLRYLRVFLIHHFCD